MLQFRQHQIGTACFLGWSASLNNLGWMGSTLTCRKPPSLRRSSVVVPRSAGTGIRKHSDRLRFSNGCVLGKQISQITRKSRREHDMSCTVRILQVRMANHDFMSIVHPPDFQEASYLVHCLPPSSKRTGLRTFRQSSIRNIVTVFHNLCRPLL
jgi:hypothetical protein